WRSSVPNESTSYRSPKAGRLPVTGKVLIKVPPTKNEQSGQLPRGKIFGLAIEPIPKSSEEDEEAGELHEAKEVLRIKLPADKNATLPLYPGEEAFNQPAPGISPKPSSILRGALAAIGSVRRDHLDAVFA